VAGAVVLRPDLELATVPVKLRDSKKLSSKQRDLASAWIHEHAVAIGLGWVEPAEVDKLGLTKSVRLAMERAVAEIRVDYDEIIIDGNINYFPDNPKARALIKADDSVPCVSAASIVAKVTRDAYMTGLSTKYIGYGFEKHVGYGTAVHIAALQRLGVTDMHRLSYKPVRALLT
jgi:ribonuclease HII